MNQKVKKVLSASRRIDMVATDPDGLTNQLIKYQPENIHTIVLWTKNASNLLIHKNLRNQLSKFHHICVHYSITGLGGTFFEPNVPPTDVCLSHLEKLVLFLKNPLRLFIRFDPIVHFLMPDNSALRSQVSLR